LWQEEGVVVDILVMVAQEVETWARTAFIPVGMRMASRLLVEVKLWVDRLVL